MSPGRLDDLLRRHETALRRIAARILHDESEALDVVQESFMALDAVLGGLDERSVTAWLVRTTARRALDRRRRESRRPRTLLGGGDGALIDPDWRRARPDEREDRAAIERALAALSPRQAEIVRARLQDEESFAAIARRLGISAGAAKTHFGRGLLRLRELLPEHGDDDDAR